MVDFNDRRLTESQKTPTYVRPDVQKAIDSHLAEGTARRVSLSFNAGHDENGALIRENRSGYLRADESGNPALFPNARSSRGRSIDSANLYSINSSRRNRKTGTPDIFWQRLSGPYSLPGDK